MASRLIGFSCRNGDACNPGKPARPVWTASCNPDHLCWQCWAAGRRVEAAEGQQRLVCDSCGGDPRGGEVVPVFGAGDPLMFCAGCARARRVRAEQGTEGFDPGAVAELVELEAAWELEWRDGEAA